LIVPILGRFRLFQILPVRNFDPGEDRPDGIFRPRPQFGEFDPFDPIHLGFLFRGLIAIATGSRTRCRRVGGGWGVSPATALKFFEVAIEA
jgi:hypothetical protein